MRIAGVVLPALTILCLGGGAWAALTPAQEEALRAVAKGQPAQWTDPDARQVKAPNQKAEAYLANFKQHHLPNGLEADILWADNARTAAKVYEGLGDSACWQGHYLAALALKYAATKDAETRDDILDTLDTFRLLATVSGRDGYLARYAGPESDEAYRAYYRVYGRGEDPAQRSLLALDQRFLPRSPSDVGENLVSRQGLLSPIDDRGPVTRRGSTARHDSGNIDLDGTHVGAQRDHVIGCRDDEAVHGNAEEDA